MERQYSEYTPIRVYSTFNLTNLLLAKMALDREGIQYQTINETFGSLHAGADGLATIDVLVDKSDAERATEALKQLIEGKK